MTAEYERQLNAIRQALLRTTLEQAPTRVFSSAWIDQHGRLHEDAQFSSDATVRGVRVLSYVQDATDPAEAEATIAVDMLPAGLVPRPAAAPAGCTSPASRWRNLLHLQVQALPAMQAEQAHIAEWILRQARLAWLPHAQRLQRWQVQAPPMRPANAYERYLHGPPAGEGWRAVLQVAPAAPQITPAPLHLAGLPAGHGAEAGWPAPGLPEAQRAEAVEGGHQFELTLTVGESAGSAPVWQASSRLHIPAAWLAQGPAFWNAQMGQVLQARMAEWVQALDARGACLPVQFDVAPADNAWTLQAGATSGLKAGDRLLILDRSQVPQRMLQPGTVSSLALVEVQHVEPHRARLRQLAGPALGLRGDWVAFPF